MHGLLDHRERRRKRGRELCFENRIHAPPIAHFPCTHCSLLVTKTLVTLFNPRLTQNAAPIHKLSLKGLCGNGELVTRRIPRPRNEAPEVEPESRFPGEKHLVNLSVSGKFFPGARRKRITRFTSLLPSSSLPIKRRLRDSHFPRSWAQVHPSRPTEAWGEAFETGLPLCIQAQNSGETRVDSGGRAADLKAGRLRAFSRLKIGLFYVARVFSAHPYVRSFGVYTIKAESTTKHGTMLK